MAGLRTTPTDQELEQEFASLIALLRVVLRDLFDRDEQRPAPLKGPRYSERFSVRMSMSSHGSRTHN